MVLIAGLSRLARGGVGRGVQGGVLVTRRVRVAALAGVLGGVILSALAVAVLVRRDGPDGFRGILSGRVSQPGLSSVPAAAQSAVSGTLGAADRAYWAIGPSTAPEAVSGAQGLGVRFSPAGVVSVRLGSSLLTLQLAAVGVSERLHPPPAVAPRAHRNRVWYARGVVSEWYVNGPLGLEQGFMLARRLGGHGGGPTLSLAAGGNLHPVLASGGRSLSFRGAGGWSAVSYRGLVARDARGRSLGAWLSLNGSRIEIHVDDRGARYPLRIDPFIQQGSKLVGTDATDEAFQGASVALSADGSTGLIGGPDDNRGVGAAWVFTRSGSTWTQQGPKLVGTGAGDVQGSGVALSADGNTALIGGQDYNDEAAAAWVYTRAGSTWTQQGSMVVGTGVKGDVGASVALSADGNTALIGDPYDNHEAGAAWVFTRSGSTWTQQGKKLAGTGATDAQQGYSVALSGDGSTALIGGPIDNDGAGAAWVFTRSGSTWTQQGKKLAGTGATDAQQGASVALSGDGSTALIGGPDDNEERGAAWVFTRSGSTWTKQGKKLAGTGATDAQQGYSVALSGDGSTALIGGPDDNEERGAAWVFTRSGSTWTQEGKKLAGTGGTDDAVQGSSVVLSGDGSTALIGGPVDNSDAGAAWVWVSRPGPSPPTAPASARLAGIPAACVLAPLVVRVRGTGIASVSWSLDGKPIRGRAVHPGTWYAASVSLTPGLHRLIVRVTFVQRSHHRARVFHRSVSGCPSAPPRVTG